MKSIKSDGVISFEVTESNNRKLKALIVYARMLDYIVSQNGEKCEQLNADGVINSLIDDITDRRIKELVKRHGFENDGEFIDLVGACESGESAFNVIKCAEKSYYKTSHEHILSQIPVEDRQLEITFE